MVTLLGFFFILSNVALLELFIPDLKGPVGFPRLFEHLELEEVILRCFVVEL